LAYVYWWGSYHNLQPLVMSLPLKRGEHASPFFKTDLHDSYQISLMWDGSIDKWVYLDMDWKVVDDSGALIEHGTYNNRLLGNGVTLGHYHSKRDLRQRIILRNLQDAQGLDSADPKLEIGLPSRNLELAYGAGYASQFASIVASPGGLILIFLLIRYAISGKTLADAS
jgi:hypothetical protein